MENFTIYSNNIFNLALAFHQGLVDDNFYVELSINLCSNQAPSHHYLRNDA